MNSSRKALDIINISPVKLRLASRHRCVSFDEVNRAVIAEDDTLIVQDITYKDLRTKALYMIKDSRLKKVQMFNNNKSCKLVKKSIYEKK